MSIPDIIVGTLPGSQLSVSGLIRRLRMQGRLRSLVFDALTEQLVQDEACRVGLSVTGEELQSAANAFRRRHGLSTTADTHAWLSMRGMSVDDLKASLEHDLLVAKLRQHLTTARVEGHFATHQTGYERLRLAQLCVGRDDLANELASQVRDDGRELDAVAGEHNIRVMRGESFRHELASPLTEALASTGPGELVGPVVTSQGFVLILIEESQPSTLDLFTREHIENELFTAWVAERMRTAKIELTLTDFVA